MNARLILPAALAALLLSAGAGLAASTQWKVDPVHSSASFTAVHLALAHVTGTIPIKSASITMPATGNVPTAVQAELDPSNLDTHNGNRDSDLKSPHFFDVQTYPAMSFTSTSITATDDKHITIVGNLTMHGQTKPVTLSAVYLGRAPGMHGEPHVGYTATTTIDRTQWGMTYGYPIVSNNIDLSLEIDAISQ